MDATNTDPDGKGLPGGQPVPGQTVSQQNGPERAVAAGEDELRGHTFDGIEEFDNRLPRWWLWTFYIACIFSLFYWAYYHGFLIGKSPMQEYNEEVAAFETKQMSGKPITDASLKELSTKNATVTLGQKLFVKNCAECHNEDGSGNIGPNLTDVYWLHGAKPTDIFKTVDKGVLAKSMPAWGSTLGRTRCQQVVAFVLTIQNTNRPGKGPEGKKASQE